MGMPVYEALAVELQRQGVRTLFGLMGEDVAKFIACLPDHQIEYYSSRHEASAIGMADGYARVSHDVGVVVVSRGPGLLNCLTALTTSAKASSPVVVLVASTAVGLAGEALAVAAAKAPKHVDQGAVLSAAGITNVTLHSPASLTADLAAVLDRARAGMTIVVNVPTDVLNAEAGDAPAQVTLPPVTERAAPAADAIAQVADLVAGADKVVVMAGRGAVRAQARAALEQLGERCGAIMATSLLGRSMFAGNPYDVDIMGEFATAPARALLREADVVLAFGASLNNLTTLGGEVCPKAEIVQFDIESSAFGRHITPRIGVLGDVQLAAAALTAELERRGHSSTGYRTEAVRSKLADFHISSTYQDVSKPGALDPRTLLLAIDEALPRERTIAVDAGHHMAFQAAYLSVPGPEAWVWPLDFSAIGSGTGVGLGAAIAQPGKFTMLGLGDGGLMTTLGEIDTAVRYKIPILILVINDSAYGAEVHFLRIDDEPDELALFDDCSFEKIATSMGARGMTISTLDDVAQLKAAVEDLDGPLVVDCKITLEVRAPFIEAWQRLTKPQKAVGAHDTDDTAG